jgi:hypothetical protein
MIAFDSSITPLRNDDKRVAPAVHPILRRAAGPAPAARATAPAQISDALRSAIRALAPQLGGAAVADDTNVAGMFGQAANAGIHGTGDLARDPMGAPGLAGAIAQLRAALSSQSASPLPSSSPGVLGNATIKTTAKEAAVLRTRAGNQSLLTPTGSLYNGRNFTCWTLLNHPASILPITKFCQYSSCLNDNSLKAGNKNIESLKITS